MQQFLAALRDPQLARLNYGVFVLHTVLMALFIAVPLELRAAGLAADRHWQVYLPVMLGSFLLMLPAIIGSGRSDRLKPVFVGSIVALLVVQMLMPWAVTGVGPIVFFLLAFFTAFNVLEALLPAVVSRVTAPGTRGIALGVFTSLQFLGTFVGAAVGGYLYGRFGTTGIVVFDAVLLAVWAKAAFETQVPAAIRAGARS
jgi:predicted MFS family arabinose efflux permease